MSEFHCDSPIEWAMARQLDGKCDESIEWITQHPIETPGQKYRVDFFAEAAGRRVVVECDGRDYHEFQRDRTRDLRMIAAAGVTDVIRFRGCDVHHEPEQCVEAMRHLLPYLFRPDCEAYTLEETILASTFMLGGDVKPILRSRRPLYELRELTPSLNGTQTYCTLIKARDGVIGQFKSPYWQQAGGGQRNGTVFEDVVAQAFGHQAGKAIPS